MELEHPPGGCSLSSLISIVNCSHKVGNILFLNRPHDPRRKFSLIWVLEVKRVELGWDCGGREVMCRLGWFCFASRPQSLGYSQLLVPALFLWEQYFSTITRHAVVSEEVLGIPTHNPFNWADDAEKEENTTHL